MVPKAISAIRLQAVIAALNTDGVDLPALTAVKDGKSPKLFFDLS